MGHRWRDDRLCYIPADGARRLDARCADRLSPCRAGVVSINGVSSNQHANHDHDHGGDCVCRRRCDCSRRGTSPVALALHRHARGWRGGDPDWSNQGLFRYGYFAGHGRLVHVHLRSVVSSKAHLCTHAEAPGRSARNRSGHGHRTLRRPSRRIHRWPLVTASLPPRQVVQILSRPWKSRLRDHSSVSSGRVRSSRLPPTQTARTM
jgi:hypothetical protein